MISFIVGYEELLPYKKEDYLSYIDDDLVPHENWYGISIQYSNLQSDASFSEVFMAAAFNKLICQYDAGSNWIISHDDKDMPWFLKSESNDETILPDLRAFFNRYGISTGFIGGLSLSKEIILGELLKDFTTYPFASSTKYLYKNLAVSHSTIPLVIKITGHKTIDVISTDIRLINEIEKMEGLDDCKLIRYR